MRGSGNEATCSGDLSRKVKSGKAQWAALDFYQCQRARHRISLPGRRIEPVGPNKNPVNQGLAGQLSGLATDPTVCRFGADVRRQSGRAENSSAIGSRGSTLRAKRLQ